MGRDYLYRLHGEEFVVLLRDTNLATGRMVAEKLRKAIETLDLAPAKISSKENREEMWEAGSLRLVHANQVYQYNVAEDIIEVRARTDLTYVIETISKLPREINDKNKGDTEQPLLTVSFGVANCPENATDVNDLQGLADDAQIEAKTKGRNTVVLSQEKAS